jgi:hypothetical protein
MGYSRTRDSMPTTYVESRHFSVDGFMYSCMISDDFVYYDVTISTPTGEQWEFSNVPLHVFEESTQTIHRLFVTGRMDSHSPEH